MKIRVLAGATAALIFSMTPVAAETIYVRTLAGESTPIEIALDASVAALKDAIAETQGTPAERQRLIFAGSELEDERSLADYNMHDESTVHLVIKLTAP